MYKCDICGRELKKKTRYAGYILCPKHMRQYHKYGIFLDNISRTNTDLNDFVIEGKIARFSLYNQKNIKVSEFLVDKEDVYKVQYHKWRIGHKHVVTGSGKDNIRELSHIVLNIPKEKDSITIVDHVDGNPLNNQKENLRICQQQQNVWNKTHMSSQ